MPVSPALRGEMRRRADAVDSVSDDARAIIERVPPAIARRLAFAYGVDPDSVADAGDAGPYGLPGDTRVEAEIRRDEGNDAAQRAATMRLTSDDFIEFVRSAGIDAARDAWATGVVDFTPEGLTDLQREVIREAVAVEADALFGRIASDYGRETNRAITNAALRGLLDDAAIADTVRSLVDSLPSGNTTTEIVTATARVDRVAQAQNRARLEQGGDVLMVYMGPDDTKTRPFCDALVGKALTPALVSDLDNGQTGRGSAEVDCGGYNCRHGWVTIDAADAEDLGVTVGDAGDVAAANAAGARSRKKKGRR